MAAGERDAVEGKSAPGRRARDRTKESARSRQLSLFDAEVAEAIAPPVEIKLQAPVKPIAARPAPSRRRSGDR
jgi:hypothetical protein